MLASLLWSEELPSHLRMQISWKSLLAGRTYRCRIKGGQDRTLRDAIPQASKPDLGAVTNGDSKAVISDKLHDKRNHIPVWQLWHDRSKKEQC